MHKFQGKPKATLHGDLKTARRNIAREEEDVERAKAEANHLKEIKNRARTKELSRAITRGTPAANPRPGQKKAPEDSSFKKMQTDRSIGGETGRAAKERYFEENRKAVMDHAHKKKFTGKPKGSK